MFRFERDMYANVVPFDVAVHQPVIEIYLLYVKEGFNPYSLPFLIAFSMSTGVTRSFDTIPDHAMATAKASFSFFSSS